MRGKKLVQKLLPGLCRKTGKLRRARRPGLARVRITALGGASERLLSWCMENGVRLEKIQAVPGGFCATAAAGEYRTLHRPARRCRTRLRVQKRMGAGFSLRWLWARPGLWLGAVLMLLAVQAFGEVVWSVKFVDLPAAEQAELRSLLCEMDLAEGSFATPQKIAAARRVLQNRADTLGWAALNFYRGRLVVETTPALAPQTPVQPPMTNYVAAENATVLANNVQGGFAAKVPGQTVAKGEVLIAASRPDRSGNPVWRAPLGTVTGLLEKSYSAHRPLAETAFFATGRTVSRFAFKTPLGRFTLPQSQPGYAAAAVLQKQYPLVVLGFGLPVTVQETVFAETAPQPRTLSQQAAREFARYACRAQLFAAFSDAEVLAETVQESWSDDALDYTLTVQFRANIAVREQE